MEKTQKTTTMEDKTRYIQNKIHETFGCKVPVTLGRETKYVAHIFNVPQHLKKRIADYVNELEKEIIDEEDGYLIAMAVNPEDTARYYPGCTDESANKIRFPTSLEIANAVTIPYDPIMGGNNL